MESLYVLVIVGFLSLGAAFTILIIQGFIDESKNNKKAEGNARGTGTTGQVHKATVNATKSVDARPRKAKSPVKSKKVLPWKQ